MSALRAGPEKASIHFPFHKDGQGGFACLQVATENQKRTRKCPRGFPVKDLYFFPRPTERSGPGSGKIFGEIQPRAGNRASLLREGKRKGSRARDWRNSYQKEVRFSRSNPISIMEILSYHLDKHFGIRIQFVVPYAVDGGESRSSYGFNRGHIF
jgi:hypothetical protein